MDLEPNPQQRGYTPSIQPGSHIIEYDAPSPRQVFKLADRRRFGHVEEPEKHKADKRVTPIKRTAEKRNPLAGDFINHDELRVLVAGLAGGNGGGRHSGNQGERDSGYKCDEHSRSGWMNAPSKSRPKQYRSHRAPSPRTGFAVSCPEKRGDKVRPGGLIFCWWRSREISLHSSLRDFRLNRCGPLRPDSPKLRDPTRAN